MKRILIVEDEAILLRATAAALRASGFSVETACGGEEALALIAERSFDVALVDLMMPRMSGLELIRAFQARAPGLRVVLTSSFPMTCGQIARLGLGHVRFVPKPMPLSDLVAALEMPDSAALAIPAAAPIGLGPATPPGGTSRRAEAPSPRR